MTRDRRDGPIVATAAMVAVLLSGCLTADLDGRREAVLDATPSFANAQPSVAMGLEFVTQLKDVQGNPFPSGAGNFVFGDYVFGSGLSAGFFIADVSNPEDPVLVYRTPPETETPFARKADLVAHPDGRRTLVLATQDNGMHFWNVTNPLAPHFAAHLEFDANHNIAVVPGTELVFNQPSQGRAASNALIDASDPYNPRILGDYGTHGCHGTTFSGTSGQPGFRAYCAAIQRTEIWDLDGLDPDAKDFGIKLLGAVEVADSPIMGSPAANPQLPSNPTGITRSPARNLHHFAAASNDGRILLVGDEHAGGNPPGACFAHEPATGASTPAGALWFYDITDPGNATLLSWISPPAVPPRPDAPSLARNATTPPADPLKAPARILASAYTTVPNCTSHFGTVIPGEDKIVIAWYSAGVLLIDFGDPRRPVILDQYLNDNVDTWNARAWNGYVFTGDMKRGMDVLKIV